MVDEPTQLLILGKLHAVRLGATVVPCIQHQAVDAKVVGVTAFRSGLRLLDADAEHSGAVKPLQQTGFSGLKGIDLTIRHQFRPAHIVQHGFNNSPPSHSPRGSSAGGA